MIYNTKLINVRINVYDNIFDCEHPNLLDIILDKVRMAVAKNVYINVLGILNDL